MSATEIIPHDRTHTVAKALQMDVRLYLAIAGGVSTAVLYAIATDGFLFPIIALFAGLVAGAYPTWNDHPHSVVSRLNMYGTVFLVGYVLFQLGGQLVKPGAFGTELMTAVYAFIGAAIVGRGYVLRHARIEALEENPKLHAETK